MNTVNAVRFNTDQEEWALATTTQIHFRYELIPVSRGLPVLESSVP